MKFYTSAALAALVPLILLACGTQSKSGSPTKRVLTIDYNTSLQEIDGFGGSNAWTRLPRDSQAAQEIVDLLYSRSKGVGFTILRNRIPFKERLEGDYKTSDNDGFVVRKADNTYDFTTNADGTKTFKLNWKAWDLESTKQFIEYIHDLGEDGPEELVVMSSPWTPPNNRVTRWKEDVVGVNSRMDGAIDWTMPDVWGRLKRDKYEDYADLLADYVKNFEANIGHPLSILSIQNEPGWKVKYESAYWNGTDLRDFLVLIEQRFPKKGLSFGDGGIGIMMPEFENFGINYNSMIKPSIDEPASERIISHIALHQYNGAYEPPPQSGARAFPDIIATGKRFWQTEVSGSGPNLPVGIGIENALYYARMIHFDLTLTQMNGFLFWWLWTHNSDDKAGSLIIVDGGDDVIPTKRLYAMGQYSRFIRPGWRRIECNTYPAAMVYASAYRNPNSKEIAVVIINDRVNEAAVPIELSGATFDRIEAWRTSEEEGLKPLGRQRMSGNTTVKLPPKSITTFYGRVK